MVLINKLFSKISKRVFLYPLAAAFLVCMMLLTSCNSNIDGKAKKLINDAYMSVLKEYGYPIKLSNALYLDDAQKYFYLFAFRYLPETFFADSVNFMSKFLNNIDRESELYKKGVQVRLVTHDIGSSLGESIMYVRTYIDEETNVLKTTVDTSYMYPFYDYSYIPTYEDYKLLSESFADYEITVYCSNYKISETEKSEFQRIANDFENIEFVGLE